MRRRPRRACSPSSSTWSSTRQQFAAERKGVLALFDPAPAATRGQRHRRGARRAALAPGRRRAGRGPSCRAARHRADELAERDRRAGRSAPPALQHDCHAGELVEAPLVDDIERAEPHLAGDGRGDPSGCVAARQRAAEQASAAAGRGRRAAARPRRRPRPRRRRALAGVDGVLGTLLDLVRIDAGWEPAVEAALGEALTAVVVADPAAPAGPSHALRGSDTTGAVLALGLAGAGVAARRRPVGDPVRPHVVGRPARRRPPARPPARRRRVASTTSTPRSTLADRRPGRRRRHRRRRPLRRRRLARRRAPVGVATAAALAEAEARAADVAPGGSAQCDADVAAAAEARRRPPPRTSTSSRPG